MRVELLYADGDPAAMPARQNLVEVLTEDAFETPIQMVAVGSARGRRAARHARLAHDPDRRRRHRPRLGWADRPRAAPYATATGRFRASRSSAAPSSARAAGATGAGG